MTSLKRFRSLYLTDIFQLDKFGRAELIDCWIRMHGRTPPKHLSTLFLRRALAFELQCKQFGGHSPKIRRALKTALNQDGAVANAPSNSPILSAGTQLVREWNGRTYRVEVLENGLLLDGKSYRSLSAIAKKITGSNWSGPRFFGLANRPKTDTGQ